MRFLGLRPTNKEIKETMKLLDKNGNGRVDKREFKVFLKNYIKENPEAMSQEEAIRAAFKVFDKDGNGSIGKNGLMDTNFTHNILTLPENLISLPFFCGSSNYFYLNTCVCVCVCFSSSSVFQSNLK